MLDSFPCKILTKISARILVHFWLARLPRFLTAKNLPRISVTEWWDFRKLAKISPRFPASFLLLGFSLRYQNLTGQKPCQGAGIFFFGNLAKISKHQHADLDVINSLCTELLGYTQLTQCIRQIQIYFFPCLSLCTFSSEPPVTFCFLKKPIWWQALRLHQSILRLCNVTSGLNYCHEILVMLP